VQARIFEYGDLLSYETINDLLPGMKFSFAIILIQYQRHEGHWVCLLKYNDGKTIEFFNSLGNDKPNAGLSDAGLQDIDRFSNSRFSQDKPLITRLLRTTRKDQDVVYNDIPIQGDTNCCGRFVIIRILAAAMGMDLDAFNEWVEDACRRGKIAPDVLVCRLMQ